jgi:hypothetical protein
MMPDFLVEHADATAEHKAWLRAMEEWKLLGFDDINDERFNAFVRAIEAWGEHLVVLRRWASDEDRAKWLHQAERAYEKAIQFR